MTQFLTVYACIVPAVAGDVTVFVLIGIFWVFLNY